MDSSFYISTRGWSGKELPEDFIKFSFDYSFSEDDIKILRTGRAHTSLGYRWLFYSEEKIFIYRGGKCFYQLQLSPKEEKHNAIFYLYDGIEGEYDYRLDINPKKILIRILDMWFMRKCVDE